MTEPIDSSDQSPLALVIGIGSSSTNDLARKRGAIREQAALYERMQPLQ